MLNATHPDDERLSALASRDVDVAADASLTDHLAGCDRCASTVAELTALRSALADLPDLQPSRPLQLLPPAESEPATGAVGGWVQRLFRPLLTAGAALAVVGVVGTALPASMESLFQNVGTTMSGGADAQEDHGQIETLASGEAAPAAGEDTDLGGDDERAAVPPAERSPWPMILFTGVALMIGAALLRWILVPRAG
jgi:anti-sigma factor RsiW